MANRRASLTRGTAIAAGMSIVQAIGQAVSNEDFRKELFKGDWAVLLSFNVIVPAILGVVVGLLTEYFPTFFPQREPPPQNPVVPAEGSNDPDGVLARLSNNKVASGLTRILDQRLAQWLGQQGQRQDRMAFGFLIVFFVIGLMIGNIKTDTARIPEIQGDTIATRKDVAAIVVLLEKELQIKNQQILFLQDQVTQLTPSKRARELAAKIPPDADPYALALKATAERRFEDARRLLDKAAATKEVELARVYQSRGDAETYDGRYKDAVTWYRKELSLRPGGLEQLNLLGIALARSGENAEAEAVSRKALETSHRENGANHPVTALMRNNLGGVYFQQGKLDKAEQLFRQALEIQKSAFGSEDPLTATTRNNLGSIYLQQGKPELAKPHIEQALKMKTQELGPEHNDTISAMVNLSAVYCDLEKYSEGERLLKKALALREKKLGARHPDTAVIIASLGSLYYRTGKLSEAESLTKRALDVCEEVLGPEDSQTATCLFNLGNIYRRQGKYVQAENLLECSLIIRKKMLGGSHVDTLSSLVYLDMVYKKTGRSQQLKPVLKWLLTKPKPGVEPDIFPNL